MFKYIMLFLLTPILLYGSNSFSILYKVEKDNKKLGYYEVNFCEDNIVSNSYGAANKLNMFATKRIKYVKNGYKTIEFEKNNKSDKFKVITKLFAVDEATKKQYIRKFKKVKTDDMLFIVKNNKKSIELFNKRKIVIKTLDELLSDIYNDKLQYEKFILFDKLGVMKMIARVEKYPNKIVIFNASKNKEYMKIIIKESIPVSIESLISNWKVQMIKSGVFKQHKLDLSKLLSKKYKSNLSNDLKESKVLLTKVKKIKSFYEFNGELTFILPTAMSNDKAYKQKQYCKKLFKLSKVKHKKIEIENGSCVAAIRDKIKIKELKKSVLEELMIEHKQLKITKKVKFTNDSIIYEVL